MRASVRSNDQATGFRYDRNDLELMVDPPRPEPSGRRHCLTLLYITCITTPHYHIQKRTGVTITAGQVKVIVQ